MAPKRPPTYAVSHSHDMVYGDVLNDGTYKKVDHHEMIMNSSMVLAIDRKNNTFAMKDRHGDYAHDEPIDIVRLIKIFSRLLAKRTLGNTEIKMFEEHLIHEYRSAMFKVLNHQHNP